MQNATWPGRGGPKVRAWWPTPALCSAPTLSWSRAPPSCCGAARHPAPQTVACILLLPSLCSACLRHAFLFVVLLFPRARLLRCRAATRLRRTCPQRTWWTSCPPTSWRRPCPKSSGGRAIGCRHVVVSAGYQSARLQLLPCSGPRRLVDGRLLGWLTAHAVAVGPCPSPVLAPDAALLFLAGGVCAGRKWWRWRG